jgi:hypothetical protein
MKIVKAASALILALGLSATGALATGTANASTLPVVQAINNGWSGMTIRPGAIYVGNGGAPFVRRLTWSSWGGSTAHASGQLVQQDSNCTLPSYRCPVSKRAATVYLQYVRYHNGSPYFKKMRWNWTSRNGYSRVMYWLFGPASSSYPAWQPR